MTGVQTCALPISRTHSPEQIKKLRASLREFGFVNPVIIDREFNVIAGHGRIMAAKEENIPEVPCVYADHLTEAQKKAYIIADNRMALGGWLGWFLGGCDGLIVTLVAFVAVDYITGVMCAVADRRLSSAVGFKGICRKVLIFLLVGMGNLLDVYVIGNGSVLRTAVVFFYISNEGVSLAENAAHLGLPVPEKLKAVLEQLHDRDGKEG